MQSETNTDFSLEALTDYFFRAYRDTSKKKVEVDLTYEKEAFELHQATLLAAIRTSLTFLNPNVATRLRSNIWMDDQLSREADELLSIADWYKIRTTELNEYLAPIQDFDAAAVASFAIMWAEEDYKEHWRNIYSSLERAEMPSTSYTGENPSLYRMQAVSVVCGASTKITEFKRGDATMPSLSVEQKKILEKALDWAKVVAKGVDKHIMSKAFQKGVFFDHNAQYNTQFRQAEADLQSRFKDRKVLHDRTDLTYTKNGAKQKIWKEIEPYIAAEYDEEAKDYCELAWTLSRIAAHFILSNPGHNFCGDKDFLVELLDEHIERKISKENIKLFVKKLSYFIKSTPRSTSETLLGKQDNLRDKPLLSVGQFIGFDRCRVATHPWPLTLGNTLRLFDNKGGRSRLASNAYTSKLSQALEDIGLEVTINPNGNDQEGDVDLHVFDPKSGETLALQIKISRLRPDDLGAYLARGLAHKKANEQLEPFGHDYRLIVSSAIVDVGTTSPEGIGISEAVSFLQLVRNKKAATVKELYKLAINVGIEEPLPDTYPNIDWSNIHG